MVGDGDEEIGNKSDKKPKEPEQKTNRHESESTTTPKTPNKQ